MGRVWETNVRVRFADTDADGGVYYANYLTYFAQGRHDLLREAGISLKRLETEDGLRCVVVEASCNYRAPAYFDELLTVRTTIERLGNSSIKFTFETVRSEKDGSETLIATGTTTQVFINDQNKSVPIPPPIREALS